MRKWQNPRGNFDDVNLCLYLISSIIFLKYAHVMQVGMRAVNMRNSMPKNRQPALL